MSARAGYLPWLAVCQSCWVSAKTCSSAGFLSGLWLFTHWTGYLLGHDWVWVSPKLWEAFHFDHDISISIVLYLSITVSQLAMELPGVSPSRNSPVHYTPLSFLVFPVYDTLQSCKLDSFVWYSTELKLRTVWNTADRVETPRCIIHCWGYISFNNILKLQKTWRTSNGTRKSCLMRKTRVQKSLDTVSLWSSSAIMYWTVQYCTVQYRKI